MEEIINEIKELKAKRDAIIIVHNYQREEVQDIADFLGDSLEMARAGKNSNKKVIVVCGVDFMAQTAKILNPDKTVLIPDPEATCPMAHMIDPEILQDLKAKNPDALIMCYVNTTAEIKALSDVCCTSANAVHVLSKIENGRPVIFIPDISLGNWARTKTGRNVILYNGFCPTHHRILPEDVKAAKEKYPDALVVSHPECHTEVIEMSDYVASTSGMVKYIKETNAKTFIVCTEQGLNYRIRKENPDKIIVSPSDLNICPNMKKITLEKVRDSLLYNQFEIKLDEDVMDKARAALERMLAL